MIRDPLVSAIIPTYNRASFISDAVDSVLKQTYANVEVIVVDDGSTDATLEQLTKYGSRIRVVTQDNRGPAGARNRGIAMSSGELIAFLDSDDLWLPSKIDRQVALLQRVGQSVPCCLCNITMRWRNKEFTSFEVAWLNPPLEEGLWLNVDDVLATRFVLFNQGIIVRRPVLERLGGFDESIRFLEDYDLPLRLSLEGPWSFIREPLVVWRESATNSVYKDTQREDICTKECMVQVFEKHIANMRDRYHHGISQDYVSRELKRARRKLRAAKMSRLSSWGASTLGNSLQKIEQYRSAAFRRSPWFPKMTVSGSINHNGF